MTRSRTTRLLLDEIFAARIADLLQARGLDCRAVVADPSMVGLDNTGVVEAALREGRAVVTNNVADYERVRRRLVAERHPVPGLIFTSDVSFPRNRRFVGRLVEALARTAIEQLVERHGGVVWLEPRSAEGGRPGRGV